MICINCKAQIADGAQFCPECGCRQVSAPVSDYGAPQAAPYGSMQQTDLDATQAAPFGSMQQTDLDATQAAPFAVTQAMNYGATQAADYQPQGYGQPQPDYGYVPPVVPPTSPVEPPKKSGKGAFIAIAGAVAVLAVVAGILAFKFLPDIGVSKKDDDDKKEESTTAVSTLSNKHGSQDDVSLPPLTAPQVTAPGIIDVTGEEIIVPTVPRGNDTVNIGDVFRPTQAPVTEPVTRPKPTSPPVYTEVYTDSYYEDYTYYDEPSEYYGELMDQPFATVDSYADCVHIGVYVYDENGDAGYGEIGYFYKDGNVCLFMDVDGESVVIETDEYSGFMTAYLDEGNGYYMLDTTQEKCEEVGNFIVYQLVELGLDRDVLYPEYQYGYMGDDYVENIGNSEFYDLYDEYGSYVGAVVVDEYSGYYVAVFDEYDNFVYLTDFIDTSGYYLPYDFR